MHHQKFNVDPSPSSRQPHTLLLQANEETQGPASRAARQQHLSSQSRIPAFPGSPPFLRRTPQLIKGMVNFEELYGKIEDEDAPTNVYPYQEGPDNHSWASAIPKAQGLYLPDYEKDACGVGFACHIRGQASHKIISDAQSLLCNMTHRGAVGSDARDGDGAGVMTSIPHKFFVKNFARETGFDLPPQVRTLYCHIIHVVPT